MRVRVGLGGREKKIVYKHREMGETLYLKNKAQANHVASCSTSSAATLDSVSSFSMASSTST